MGLAPLPYCPMFSEPGPLARFLPICLGVHRSPCASVCVYVVIAWLSSGPLLCVRPAPSADPWALVPRCAICGALGALRSGLRARLAASLAALLGPSRGLLVYSVTQWLGMKVTPGSDFMGCFLVPQDFFFWPFRASCLRLLSLP
ncbi:hypothetical protein V6N13_098936 [Hibiscus sabdariffa]